MGNCENCFEPPQSHPPRTPHIVTPKHRLSEDPKHNDPTPKPPTPPNPQPEQPSQDDLIDKFVNQVIQRQSQYTQKYTKKKLSLDDFEKTGMLGEGGFGAVYRVKRVEDEEVFAMKVISKKQLYERCMVDDLMTERMLMIKLNCRFAVKLFCSFQDKYNCYFVMEFAKGGDVYSFLVNKKQEKKVEEYVRTGENGPRFIIACVILALEKLHSSQVVYRDLKPENVLIFQDGYAKLADFGLAKTYKPGDLEFIEAGTRVYFAPQMIESQQYSVAGTDFWTLGIFLHQLVFLKPPFGLKVIEKGKFNEAVEQWQAKPQWPRRATPASEQLRDLIKQFLKLKPDDRLGYNCFSDIKEHKFFKKLDWTKLAAQQLQSPLKSIVYKYPLQASNTFSNRHPANSQSLPNVDGFTFACEFSNKYKMP